MPSWLPTRPSLRPVTAATATGTTPTATGTGVTSSKDVWRLWRELGELHYSTTFMARQVGRLDWRVTLAGTPLDADDSADLVATVTDPSGGRQLTATMALHMQVPGEFMYRRHADTGVWQVAGADQTRRLDADDNRFDLSLHTINRDPADPTRPDSPVRAAAPVARELLLLSALARSQARNRTAQRGLLLYPAEQQWADGFDFGAMLEGVMTAPLANEQAASAVVPPQVPTPSDLIGDWRLLDLTTGWDDDLPERIVAVTRRLALVLDHPPEVLLGVADLNHWSAWQISEETYRAHVEPLARWPASTLARAIAAVAELDDTQVRVDPDPAALLARLPTVADTLTAYQLGLVSPEFTRRVLGAAEEDAGTGDNLAPAPAPDDDTAVDGDPGAPDPGDGPDDGVPATVAAAAGDAVDPDRLGDVLYRIDADLLEAGATAADLAVTAARSKIGAKVRTALRGTPLADDIDNIPNTDVVATVGVEQASRHVSLDQVAADVVTDALAGFWDDRLAAAAVRVEHAAGIRLPARPRQTAASVALLTGLVTETVLDTLDRTETRRGARPTDAVRRAIDVAGGNGDPGAVVAAAGVAAPVSLRASGFARGVDALSAIRTQTGLTAQRWRWRYGDPGDRGTPHPGHLRLDGVLMSNDGRARTHDPGSGETWRAYPGDHVGCRCDIVPAFTTEGTG